MSQGPSAPERGNGREGRGADVSAFWHTAAKPDAAPTPRSAAVEMGRGRLAILRAVILVAFGTVCWQLFHLCFLTTPANSSVSALPVAKYSRADIVDRNGQLLARDIILYDISINPKYLTDPAGAAASIGKALPQVDASVLRRRFLSGHSFVYIVRNATPRDAQAVYALGLPGVVYDRLPQRAYPQGALFSHVLGYVDIDNKGIAGIELARDALLRERTAKGAPLQLSVDTQIQFTVRDVLQQGLQTYGAQGGVGLVMDVNNGEFLALVSLPDYDPNHPDFKNSDAMLNRAVTARYEMGSTFKTFTMAIAYDTGTIKPTDKFDATHPLRIGGHLITDFDPTNAWLTPEQIFIHSSNIGAAQIAMLFGPDVQRTYLGTFGLLSPSPIELPEVMPPIVQTHWGRVETATIAYGYGIAVSPVQLASGIAALVNGGYYVPATLIKRLPGQDFERRQVVGERAGEAVRELMRDNAVEGTGRASNVPGYDVGGKTGTANKQDDGGYAGNQRVSSFAAVFPVDSPRYLVLVMLDTPTQVPGFNGLQPPTGGATAAPLSGQIISRIAPILGMPPEGQEITAQR